MIDADKATGGYRVVLGPQGDDPLTVLFEPGAGEFELRAGESFQIDISGSEGEVVELSHGPGYLSVWLGPTLSVTVVDSTGGTVPLLGY